MSDVKSAAERALERVDSGDLIVHREPDPEIITDEPDQPKIDDDEPPETIKPLISRAIALAQAIAYACRDDGRLTGTFPVGLVSELLLPFVQKWEVTRQEDDTLLIHTDAARAITALPNGSEMQAGALVRFHNEAIDRIMKILGDEER